MDFIEQLRVLSARVEEQKEFTQTEESTEEAEEFTEEFTIET